MLYYINVSFTAIFIVEMLVKMAAFSLCGYFEDGWNWLDFFIVIISVIGLMDFLPALKSLRALRALRAYTCTRRAYTCARRAARTRGLRLG